MHETCATSIKAVIAAKRIDETKKQLSVLQLFFSFWWRQGTISSRGFPPERKSLVRRFLYLRVYHDAGSRPLASMWIPKNSFHETQWLRIGIPHVILWGYKKVVSAILSHLDESGEIGISSKRLVDVQTWSWGTSTRETRERHTRRLGCA